MTTTDFIKKRKHLIWYTRDFDNVNDDIIIEATLNYGNWEDFKKLMKIMGIKKMASIFKRQTDPRKKRTNYHPKTAHFFKRYFKRHA